jgi:hypothetical protein
VAVTVTFDSFAVATACQISAVLGCALLRSRSVHVSPPPLTEEKDWPPAAFGPSESRKASRSSFGCEVEKLGDLIVVAAVLW